MKLTFAHPVTKEFVRAIKAVATHVSRDGIRPSLNAVHFRLHEHSLDIVGTDGHRLALYRFKRELFESVGTDTSCTILLEVIQRFIKTAGTKPQGIVLDSDVGEMVADAGSTRFDAKYAAELMFPPYQQIFPNRLEMVPAVVNASYLADAAKAFDSLADRDLCGISVMTSEELGPIVITSETVHEFIVIVMPMRGTVNHVAPGVGFLKASARLPGDPTPVEDNASSAAD